MEKEKGINHLSLFSGINVAELALKELNIPVNKSFSSEICPSALKVCNHHFDLIQLGDVRYIDIDSLPDIQLLTVGSPCTDLSSIRKNRQGLDGEKSSLFFVALDILHRVKPQYFLFENVSSMSKRDRARITELLGVDGIEINSNRLTAQNRGRIYWTNIQGIIIPENKNILLKDIVEDGYVDREKANAVLTKNVPHTKAGLIRYLTKSLGQVAFYSKDFAELTKKEKLKVIDSMSNDEVKSLFRLFTIQELEQLQGLPIGYTSDVLKKTPSNMVIGRAFTKGVIKHILLFSRF
ncbi:DNA cytosine methyltransferase [Confluentibacter sediminis]|uniref:DNA cytosine methyltransferase n=1 Tax=Confluentibacter sediminis TaxID=2219045 RepID=UPI000DADF870|nr:DNA cytosine methyltransferase [Confluentibacter sediminis]